MLNQEIIMYLPASHRKLSYYPSEFCQSKTYTSREDELETSLINVLSRNLECQIMIFLLEVDAITLKMVFSLSCIPMRHRLLTSFSARRPTSTVGFTTAENI